MKIVLTFIIQTFLFLILFILTTLVGATILVTLAQRGGGFAALIIGLSSIVGNLSLFIFITFKYKLHLVSKIAGGIALLLFIPTLLYFDAQYLDFSLFN